MSTGFWHCIQATPGPLCISVGRDGKILRIDFGAKPSNVDEYTQNKYLCGAAALEIDEYLQGKRISFDLEYHLEGTAFQKAVWYRLTKIPYGETVSYMELARKTGRPDAVRAVANAVAKNPLPLLVPCHRVVRSDGRPGNYARRSIPDAEGRAWKLYLLDLEARKKLSQSDSGILSGTVLEV